MFAQLLSRYWAVTLLRGIVWILFGVALLAQPGITLFVLTMLIGVLFLVDGAFNIVSALGGLQERGWWMLLLVGLAGVVVGILTFMHPNITALALLFYVAIWAIATGVLEIDAAIRLRNEISGEFWLILAGIISVAFGVLIMARPAQGALAVLTLIAIYAIIFGVVIVAFAFRARGFGKRLGHPPGLTV
jgi:uncharacterized membrane protein HdeD (DUF308 family)